jgi:methylglyoxal synthase
MDAIKSIALVAHDNRKRDLLEWLRFNYGTLAAHNIICTGTTGRMVERLMQDLAAQNDTDDSGRVIVKLKSGPLGGDQQLGAMIAEGKIDLVIFFWDPMEPHPHDVDVKALLRIAVVYNIPIACNRSSADFMVSSSLMSRQYQPQAHDYSDYLGRRVNGAHDAE